MFRYSPNANLLTLLLNHIKSNAGALRGSACLRKPPGSDVTHVDERAEDESVPGVRQCKAEEEEGDGPEAARSSKERVTNATARSGGA